MSMHTRYYLDIFENAAGCLDKKLLAKKQVEVATGTYMNSVFLKLYKKAWTNNIPDALNSPSRIFFSVWVTDKEIKEEKLLYNIHALKLRHLKGYTIESRKFAADFRARFKNIEHCWPNVSIQFGPLTLMQGWVEAATANLQDEILDLSARFLTMDNMVDGLLAGYRRSDSR